MRPGWTEILLILVLVVILFGSAKIPGMMKNLAGGIKVFKKELKDDAKSDANNANKKVGVKKSSVKKAAHAKSAKGARVAKK